MQIDKNYKRVASYEGIPNLGDNVILAYSGGLDSSVILKVLIEQYRVNVYAVCVNIGQREDFEQIRNKALEIGAVACDVVDTVEKFANEQCLDAILFNADYEGGYHLFCPLGRIAIASVLVEYAKKYNCTTIVHASTGKGNDQVRFDSYITTLSPDMKIMAPVREWAMGREEEIEYAKQHNIPVEASLEKIYSYDQNLWGCSAEGGEIEDFKKVPPLDKILKFTSVPENGPDIARYAKIEFEHGVPVSIDGYRLSPLEVIKTANMIGSIHGIGLTHLVEDRIIGLKVRGIYEEPGADLLIKAHSALEKTISTREEIKFKEQVDRQWSELVYQGKYYNPLVKQLKAFALELNKRVSGVVTMRLYKGHCEAVAINSAYSLNNENSSFLKDNFNQNASPGFIEHYNYTQRLTHNLNA